MASNNRSDSRRLPMAADCPRGSRSSRRSGQTFDLGAQFSPPRRAALSEPSSLSPTASSASSTPSSRANPPTPTWVGLLRSTQPTPHQQTPRCPPRKARLPRQQGGYPAGTVIGVSWRTAGLVRCGGGDAAAITHAISKLIGRSRELAELGRLLPGTRLLMLTGPSGAGKTALGLVLARQRTRNSKETGVFLDQSLLTAPEHIPNAEAVAAEIANCQCLLVIDNCEHLIQAAAELVRTLLECCPALTVLATSRERLGVAGELVWSVPPLLTEEAVALFTVRARERRTDFEAIGHERKMVEAVCRRLEGETER
jgi:hypothetical protein